MENALLQTASSIHLFQCFEHFSIDVYRYIYKFLTVIELMNFDSSICSSKFRNIILSSLYGLKFEYGCKINIFILNWCNKRHIYLFNMFLCLSDLTCQSISFIQNQIYLRYLKIAYKYIYDIISNNDSYKTSWGSSRYVNEEGFEDVNNINYTDQYDINTYSSRPLISLDVSEYPQITCMQYTMLIKDARILSGVNLSSCKNLTNDVVIHMAQSCIYLTHINLSFLNINNSAIIAIANNCINLIFICIHGIWDINDESMMILTMECIYLNAIEMGYCYNITDNTIINITNYNKNLMLLNIYANDNITDYSICNLLKYNHNISYLDIGSCDMLTNNTIYSISQYCIYLKYININECQQYSNNAIKEIVKNCHFISYFNASFTHITDDTFSLLCQNCNINILHIDVSSCSELSDISLASLCLYCPNLRFINVHDCTKITHLQIDTLILNCTKLVTVLSCFTST
jgi:hypothetical protein